MNDHVELLSINNLSVAFKMYKGGLRRTDFRVVDTLSLRVNSGEIVAIVGSSGSGKSILAHSILDILPTNAIVKGNIKYKGIEINKDNIRQLRGREMALVPQSVTYLDPLMKISNQVIGDDLDRNIRQGLYDGIFKRLGLDISVGDMYPHQLSGGMIRRVLVATAVIGNASLIIADEPTPGMQQEQAIEALAIFRELADEGKGILLITHDLELAMQFADKIAVFYSGTTIELANANDFNIGTEALRHPYSKALWRAMPQNGFHSLSGFQPSCDSLYLRCPFYTRCDIKSDICISKIPNMEYVRGGYVRCHNAT